MKGQWGRGNRQDQTEKAFSLWVMGSYWKDKASKGEGESDLKPVPSPQQIEAG